MPQVIIYKQDNGAVAVMIPAPEILSQYSIYQVATKDVPSGKSFAIVDAMDIPLDRNSREGWSVSEDLLIDGVGEFL